MNPDIHSSETAKGSSRADGNISDNTLKLYEKSDQTLISLAVRCRLIPLERENELLDKYAQKKLKTPSLTSATFLHRTGTLSDQDISFLSAVCDHLELKMLDKKFGELGIANNFVLPENVKKALNLQTTIFKETKQSKLIGDILLENQEITRANKAAILLTQDRIKDELLAEALNDIATTEIEKLSLSMRFGAIAVKKEYITLDQLNQALTLQKKEVDEGNSRRYLGAILKELFDLSDENLNHVLKIQKELEKKRLSLERALEKYNSETNIHKRLAKQFEYRFSTKKLTAHLIRVQEAFEEVQVEDLKGWLNSIGINWGLCPDEEIQAYLEENIRGTEILIASGQAPEPGKDGYIEYYFDTDFKASGKSGDADLVPIVKKGDVMAKHIPPEKGMPGKDVSGLVLAPPPVKPIHLNCGEGVVRDKDFFVAEADGLAVLYQNRTLFVKQKDMSVPTRHYTGSIDMDLGEEFKDINLIVDGSILENGQVRCQHIEVLGDILGQVSAAGDLLVKGDIGKKDVREEDEPAKIKAEGDIIAGKAISNAFIVTAKSLKAPNADILSTAVQAYQDITVKNVFYNGPRPCVLQTGKIPNLKADSITSLIQNRTDELKRLHCIDEIRELEEWLQEKLDLKESYLVQQAYLKYILTLIQFKPLLGLPRLKDKLSAAQKTPEKWPDLQKKPAIVNPGAANFEREFLQDTKDMTPDQVEKHARELADIKYGMYRAAVNATRRYTHKYKTRKKEIQEKIKASTVKIRELEETIKKLTIRKDTFLLSQAYRSHSVAPAIRVKSCAAKGTVIKGRQAILTVEQDIFGVKFTEYQKSASELPQIIIEGFYD